MRLTLTLEVCLQYSHRLTDICQSSVSLMLWSTVQIHSFVCSFNDLKSLLLIDGVLYIFY